MIPCVTVMHRCAERGVEGKTNGRYDNRPSCFRHAFLAATFALFALFLAAAPFAVLGQDATPTTTGSVILATTTSTADSGLLDALAPRFLAETGYTLKPIAVGSGAALELGERGEADVLLVHSPAAERAFMEEGYGTERRTIMYNDFIIVGPAVDPAEVATASSAVDAMTRIADAGAVFVSRGDDSGTHALEKRLWESAGITPGGEWYTESGTGMGDTLNIASEREGYTISDRGTFLSLRDRLGLELLSEGDPALLNIYHIILLNPDNRPAINSEAGQAFLDFMLEPTTQRFIGGFGVEEFGEPLFTPCSDNACGVEAAATPVAKPAA